MDEEFDTDFITNILDDIFISPCENCSERTECNFSGKTKYCDRKFNTMLKAERIA